MRSKVIDMGLPSRNARLHWAIWRDTSGEMNSLGEAYLEAQSFAI